MVRQAKSYLAGAVGSAGLIAACVAIFVGLVALGASGNLPVLSSLGDDEPAAQSAAGSGEPAVGAADTSAPARGADAASSPASAVGREADAGGDSTQPLTGTAGGGGSPTGSTPQGDSDTPRTATTATRSPSRSSTPRTPPAPQAPSRPGVGLPGSQDIVDTVGDTVDQVDEELGGPLEQSGVGGAAKNATGNAAGPDSTVGETVDELGGALGDQG